VNKKKQKNFVNLDRARQRARGRKLINVFWFFFSKKNVLLSLRRPHPSKITVITRPGRLNLKSVNIDRSQWPGMAQEGTYGIG
jgi:hypothetical protein